MTNFLKIWHTFVDNFEESEQYIKEQEKNEELYGKTQFFMLQLWVCSFMYTTITSLRTTCWLSCKLIKTKTLTMKHKWIYLSANKLHRYSGYASSLDTVIASTPGKEVHFYLRVAFSRFKVSHELSEKIVVNRIGGTLKLSRR